MANDEVRLPVTALAALAGIDGLRCGPLSPLAQIPRPAGMADRAALIALVQDLDESWRACLPALLDPHLTLALIVADREQQLLGQYLWSDPHGVAAGFRADRSDEAVTLAGPFTLEQVELHLLDRLALAGVAEVPPARYGLTADEAWAMLALIDTHGTAAALRVAARVSGPPPGLTRGDIVASWEASLARPNPGWAVSLVGLLVPESVPRDFVTRLDAVLADLDRSGLVTRLAGAADDPLGDVYLLGDGLDMICRGLSAGGISFGLVHAQVTTPGRVEVMAVAGWRTPRGMALLDLSAIGEGRAELLLAGPSHFVECLHDLLGTSEPPGGDTPAPNVEFEVASVLARLQRGPVPASTTPPPASSFCQQCGRPVRAGARFCGNCGAPID